MPPFSILISTDHCSISIHLGQTSMTLRHQPQSTVYMISVFKENMHMQGPEWRKRGPTNDLGTTSSFRFTNKFHTTTLTSFLLLLCFFEFLPLLYPKHKQLSHLFHVFKFLFQQIVSGKSTVTNFLLVQWRPSDVMIDISTASDGF